MTESQSIKTAQQLDKLPAGAIIRDKDGDAWQKDSLDYWRPAGGSVQADSDYVLQFAPFQVLWGGGFDGRPSGIASTLEDLPHLAAIVDCDGDIWQKRRGEWHCALQDARTAPSHRLARLQPLKVIWEGE